MIYCVGIPGTSAHRVADPDDLFLDRCSDCEAKLFNTKSWISQLNLGRPKDDFENPKRKRRKSNAGNFHLPGSPVFSDRQTEEWRNYPKEGNYMLNSPNLKKETCNETRPQR